jgi:hypothetical protein
MISALFASTVPDRLPYARKNMLPERRTRGCQHIAVAIISISKPENDFLIYAMWVD